MVDYKAYSCLTEVVVLSSAVDYEAYSCLNEVVSQTPHYMVLQTAPSLPPAQQVFCRVIAPLHVRGNAYDFAVDLFHQEGGHVIGGHLQADAGVGAPGVVYNVVDENTFDFVAFKWVRETTRCGIVSWWSRNDIVVTKMFISPKSDVCGLILLSSSLFTGKLRADKNTVTNTNG